MKEELKKPISETKEVACYRADFYSHSFVQKQLDNELVKHLLEKYTKPKAGKRITEIVAKD